MGKINATGTFFCMRNLCFTFKIYILEITDVMLFSITVILPCGWQDGADSLRIETTKFLCFYKYDSPKDQSSNLSLIILLG